MIRRIILSLLVGTAVVALDQPEAANELADEAERAAAFCRAVPFACRAAAEGAVDRVALPFGGAGDYVGGTQPSKDEP